MLKVVTVADLVEKTDSERKKGKRIGFVPTMGALHQGHLSLIKQAKAQCDYIVVSIFVNPTQFNNPEDLERYPRDLDRDVSLLASVGCELLFAPSVKEVYPQEDTRVFSFGALESVMEGQFRPGHFNGVAQVVSRLFEMVSPDEAFFGQKDFQQLAIIRAMVKQLKLNVKIVACPTIREEDGLAMSSRNMLLNAEQRKNAPVIAKSLFESCNFASHKSVNEVKAFVTEQINSVSGFEVEYFEIADGFSLQSVNNWSEGEYIVGCIAVHVGKIRLIDNVIYKNADHEC